MAVPAAAAEPWAAGALGWDQGRAQCGAGIACSHIMQAELSCLQIDSRGDLVGDRAEHAAFSAQKHTNGVPCCLVGCHSPYGKSVLLLPPLRHTLAR